QLAGQVVLEGRTAGKRGIDGHQTLGLDGVSVELKTAGEIREAFVVTIFWRDSPAEILTGPSDLVEQTRDPRLISGIERLPEGFKHAEARRDPLRIKSVLLEEQGVVLGLLKPKV